MLVTSQNFESALKWITQQAEIAVDTETTGLRPWNGDRVIGVAVANAEQAFYFSFGHNEGYNLPRKNLPLLYEILNQVPHLILFNAKFDMQAMYQDGFRRSDGYEDVMLAAHLMNENEESFALKKLADKYLGEGSSKDEQELTKEIKQRFGQKAKKGEIWRLPATIVEPYACSDAILTYQLRDFYRPHLDTWGLTKLHHEIQVYNQVLNQIETHGVLMDEAWIKEAQQQTKPTMERIVREIREIVGWDINPNSPIQLKDYFGTESTDAETLQLLDDDPVAQLILEYRDQKKLDSTYLSSYLDLMSADNVLHATFNIHGTVAGRLSSSRPNLQNVPKSVRRAFIARPGKQIIEMDYQAAEMRLAAHYSRSPRLVQIFRDNGDPHQMVADEISGVLGFPVSRQQGKVGNFGKIYGMQAAGFSKKFGIPYEEAVRFVDAYDTRFPEIKDLYYKMQQEAANKGYIRLPTGRVRRYHNGKFQTAMNNLIQGTAAEIVRHSMTRIARQLPEAQMLLQVHDSIVFEVDERNTERLIPEIRSIMEDFTFDPPMKVDVKIGPSWGTLEEVNE